ncbi:hypothetical protein SJAG_06640 [Schizosaccharomyces japonicus yFS275]|uniref:Uncharacterized protein n=1 Tax=Schizosaccharomyces japonicus (strain yFS275 / FY16936) TaxID=402676 RepID=T0T6C5_SCHJY|nr:hypothetical protein SJAG_06640 [Schizosaccharomyces japonicus yFS275]EQC52959.1 hypothetical protein SJAG_06640 [Schizosaccharomyces japonicus yFS275]
MYLKERFLHGTAYDDENTAFDLQAGHTRRTATIVYGRTDEMPGVGSSNLLTQSLVVSKLWQDLLEIDVSLELNAPSSNSEEDSRVIALALKSHTKRRSILQRLLLCVMKTDSVSLLVSPCLTGFPSVRHQSLLPPRLSFNACRA